GIGPLQVVKDDDQRSAARRLAQQRGDRVEHRVALAFTLRPRRGAKWCGHAIAKLGQEPGQQRLPAALSDQCFIGRYVRRGGVGDWLSRRARRLGAATEEPGTTAVMTRAADPGPEPRLADPRLADHHGDPSPLALHLAPGTRQCLEGVIALDEHALVLYE